MQEDKKAVKREKVRTAADQLIGERGWIDNTDISKLTGLHRNSISMILRLNYEKMGFKLVECGAKSIYCTDKERLPPLSEIIKPKAIKRAKKETKKSPTEKELEMWMIGLHEDGKRWSYRQIVNEYSNSFREYPDKDKQTVLSDLHRKLVFDKKLFGFDKKEGVSYKLS